MQEASEAERIRHKYRSLSPLMDERMRRQWSATESEALGWGGQTTVAVATGLSRNTIGVGAGELEYRRAHPLEEVDWRIRCSGGGRKRLIETDSGLADALDALVDPVTRGDPESPLRWTCKSTGNLAEKLTRQNHPVTDRTVASLLKQAGYSLQANRKTLEGLSHPDRDAQFWYIARQVTTACRGGEPVVSVDTKKKELLGEFKNNGREWNPKGQPQNVSMHDFPDKKLGKAIPYGVYDLASNEGWVSVDIDHDTARFAAASIGRWWREMGSLRFKRARRLMITADGGGSNSAATGFGK